MTTGVHLGMLQHEKTLFPTLKFVKRLESKVVCLGANNHFDALMTKDERHNFANILSHTLLNKRRASVEAAQPSMLCQVGGGGGFLSP